MALNMKVTGLPKQTFGSYLDLDDPGSNPCSATLGDLGSGTISQPLLPQWVVKSKGGKQPPHHPELLGGRLV